MKKLVKRAIKSAVLKLDPDIALKLSPSMNQAANEQAARLQYFQDWVIPTDLETKERTSYVPTDFFGSDGIDLHEAEQLDKIKRWGQTYAPIFKALREDPQINTLSLGQSYLHNGWYPTPDAEIYAAMIADYKPRQIIEVGAGFSTKISRKVVDEFTGNCAITVIDPEPRTDVESVVDSVLYKKAEDVELAEMPIGAKTLLFIDSSHVIRARGDIPHLFNKIIPNLPSGTLVHVHDIFIPYDYPFRYQELLYTEQYMLQSLLSYSQRYKVIFTTHYMSRQHSQLMQSVFSEVVGKDDLYFGASLWFEVQ